MKSALRPWALVVAFGVNAVAAGCRHTPAITNDAAVDASVMDGNPETATTADAGMSDVGGDALAGGGASYVRVACTPLDPSPGPLFDDVECGRLTVNARPGSGGAVLPVLRLKPHTLNRKEDPVLFLAGGPGQSAVSALR